MSEAYGIYGIALYCPLCAFSGVGFIGRFVTNLIQDLVRRPEMVMKDTIIRGREPRYMRVPMIISVVFDRLVIDR